MFNEHVYSAYRRTIRLANKYLPGRTSVEFLYRIINEAYGYDDDQEPRRYDGVHDDPAHAQEDEMHQTLHGRSDFLRVTMDRHRPGGGGV